MHPDKNLGAGTSLACDSFDKLKCAYEVNYVRSLIKGNHRVLDVVFLKLFLHVWVIFGN